MSDTNNFFLESELPQTTHHFMEVAEPYYSLIKSQRKPVEGRKITPKWSKIQEGDFLTITSPGLSDFTTLVTRINMYPPSIYPDPLTAYLETETLDRTLPGVNSIKEGKKIYLQWSTKDEIMKYGMMGIHVSVL